MNNPIEVAILKMLLREELISHEEYNKAVEIIIQKYKDGIYA